LKEIFCEVDHSSIFSTKQKSPFGLF